LATIRKYDPADSRRHRLLSMLQNVLIFTTDFAAK
jgi:hypothetical protein